MADSEETSAASSAAKLRMEKRRAKLLASGEDRLKKITQSYSSPAGSESSKTPEPSDTASPKPALSALSSPPAAASSPAPKVSKSPTPSEEEPFVKPQAPPSEASSSAVPSPEQDQIRKRNIKREETPTIAEHFPTADAIEQQRREREAYDQILSLQSENNLQNVLETLKAQNGGAFPTMPAFPGMPAAAQPSPPPANSMLNRVAALLRTLFIISLGMFAVYFLVSAEKFDHSMDSWADAEIEAYYGLPPWKQFLKRLQNAGSTHMLDTPPLSVVGLDMPVWGILLLIELLLQVYRFAFVKVTLVEDDFMAIMREMGVPGMSMFQQYGKLAYDLYSTWNSVMTDVYLFIFVIGFPVMVGSFV